MRIQKIANILDTINARKLAKPLAICLTALFIFSMISVLATAPVKAARVSITPALHSSGHFILDANNNEVYLRGIGRGGDTDSMTGMWSGPGEDVFNYGQKWQTDFNVLAQKMDATFASYRDVWKVNMIRVFVPVDWWWDDQINPAQAYGEGPNQIVSYRDYIELMVQEADKYGIYVDFCPYEVLNYYKSQGNWDGIPGSLGAASLNYMRTINADEMTAWRTWWTSVANRLGQYSNVIFEMWNEPENDQQAYFNYMINAYQAIRATGSTNMVFMQYHMGLVPGYEELDWVPQFHNQLKAAIGAEPQNIAYTTHPYRRAPYPNLNWATTYEGVQAQLNTANVIPATRSNGIDVPLVFNEMGVMLEPVMYSNEYFPDAQKSEATLSTEQRMEKEFAFWDAILKNAYDLDIGVAPYYWMQTGVWYGSEALVASASWPAGAASPTPSRTGQIFIDNYVAPPPSAIITQPVETPAITAVPVPAPTPEMAIASTPELTQLPPIAVPTLPTIQTPAPTATPSPEPTPTESPTQTTTPATQPSLNFNGHYNQWYVIYWARFNMWFFYFR